MDLILCVNKPKGITSNKFIQKIKSQTKVKKIGHGGTLDPSASGVLIVGINKATKLLNHHLNDTKQYVASIQLGIETSSYDLETDIIKTSDVIPSLEEIKSVLNQFQNEYYQTPPIYSAIKVNGVAAYKYAHKNQTIELTPKKVELIKYEIIDYDYPFLKLKIDVSKGFYVRSLAHDLGISLNTYACLSDLIRTRSGNYKLEDALEFNQVIDYLSNFDKRNQ